MTEEKYNTKDIRHIDEKSQEYIAEGNRMTKELINSDGSRNWEANILLDNIKRLEQENKKLKQEVKQIGSDFIKKGDYARALERENRELKAYKAVNEDFKKAWDELKKKYTEVLKLAKENADSNEYCLQELEQENKTLKANASVIQEYIIKNEQLKTNIDSLVKINESLKQENKKNYRSALEEIREILNKECGVISNAKAVGIINEVLK